MICLRAWTEADSEPRPDSRGSWLLSQLNLLCGLGTHRQGTADIYLVTDLLCEVAGVPRLHAILFHAEKEKRSPCRQPGAARPPNLGPRALPLSRSSFTDHQHQTGPLEDHEGSRQKSRPLDNQVWMQTKDECDPNHKNDQTSQLSEWWVFLCWSQLELQFIPLYFQIKTIRVPRHTVTPASGCIQPRVKLHSLEPFPELLTAAGALPKPYSTASHRAAPQHPPSLPQAVANVVQLCFWGSLPGRRWQRPRETAQDLFCSAHFVVGPGAVGQEGVSLWWNVTGWDGACHPHLFPGGWVSGSGAGERLTPRLTPAVPSRAARVWALRPPHHGGVWEGDGRRSRAPGFSSCLCPSFARDLSLSLSIWTMGWGGIKESLLR